MIVQPGTWALQESSNRLLCWALWHPPRYRESTDPTSSNPSTPTNQVPTQLLSSQAMVKTYVFVLVYIVIWINRRKLMSTTDLFPASLIPRNENLWNTLLEKKVVTPWNEVPFWWLFIFYLLLKSKSRLVGRIYVFLCIVCLILFNVYFGKFMMTFIDIGQNGCMSIP